MTASFLEKKFAFFNLFFSSFSTSMDMTRLKKFSNITFVIVEKLFVKLDKLLLYYLSFYNEMISNEIKMASISSQDSVLHIGCGSIPATSIILNQKTGSKITAIDKDFNSIKNAKLLLSKLENVEDIEIVRANGLDLSVEDFNLVIISDGISVLDEILKFLSKSIKKNAKIIVRTNIATTDLYVLGRPYPAVDIFTIKDIVNHASYGKLSSILLEKNT